MDDVPAECDLLLRELRLLWELRLLPPESQASAQTALTLLGHSTSYFFNSLASLGSKTTD